MPENEAGRLLLEVEQIQLPPELAVVAALGLFQHLQVGVLLFLLCPRGAVDALQLLVGAVAAPVRAGDLHQLEDLQLPGRRHVRAATQVDEVAFAVERNVFVGRDRRDDLGLVLLADRFEELDRVVAFPDLAHDGLVLARELSHLLLDRFEVLWREASREREVVVEAVVDHRADRHLRLGKQLFHRVGEQMRGRVAQHLEAVGIAICDDRDTGVVVDKKRRVDQPAVDTSGKRRLRQAGTNGSGDVGDAYRRIERPL